MIFEFMTCGVHQTRSKAQRVVMVRAALTSERTNFAKLCSVFPWFDFHESHETPAQCELPGDTDTVLFTQNTQTGKTLA